MGAGGINHTQGNFIVTILGFHSGNLFFFLFTPQSCRFINRHLAQREDFGSYRWAFYLSFLGPILFEQLTRTTSGQATWNRKQNNWISDVNHTTTGQNRKTSHFNQTLGGEYFSLNEKPKISSQFSPFLARLEKFHQRPLTQITNRRDMWADITWVLFSEPKFMGKIQNLKEYLGTRWFQKPRNMGPLQLWWFTWPLPFPQAILTLKDQICQQRVRESWSSAQSTWPNHLGK